MDKQQKLENEQRAQRARNALDAYAVEAGRGPENLCDLLTDLMHMTAIDCETRPFEDELDTARKHFAAEVSDFPS